MPNIPAASLTRFGRDLFTASGCSATEAMAIAEHLVEANLTGHDSHGAGKLPEYVNAIREGRAKINEQGEIVLDAGAIIVLEGKRGMGQTLAARAVELGVARARDLGASVVGLRNAHHIGRVGAWAEQAAAAGFVSVHFVNVVGHTPYVAPYGGRESRIATNPVTIGVPATGKPPVILDFATSRIAFGKLFDANAKGEPAPENTVIDHQGKPTRDPSVVLKAPLGAILPFGDHKGSGLGFLADILAGALTGGHTNEPNTPQDHTAINNMLSILIDPGRLGNADHWMAEVNAITDWVKSSAPREGFSEVMIAGEPEQRSRAKRLAEGVPLDKNTVAALEATGRLLGVTSGW